MFGWVKRLFPAKINAPLDYTYEKYGAWPPAYRMGPKGPVPPASGYAHGRFKEVQVWYIGTHAAGLGPNYFFYIGLRPVGVNPKRGQFVSDGTGNIRFHKSDSGRTVMVRYQINGKHKAQKYVIPHPNKKPKKSA